MSDSSQSENTETTNIPSSFSAYPDLSLARIRPSTQQAYSLAFLDLCTWLADYDIQFDSIARRPRQLDQQLAAYIQDLFERGHGTGAFLGKASTTVSAVRFIAYELQDGDLPRTQAKLKGYRRIHQAQPHGAAPCPFPLLIFLAGYAVVEGHQRTAWGLVLAFFAMLRAGEIDKLRASDIMLRDGKISVRVRSSKTSDVPTLVPLLHPLAEKAAKGLQAITGVNELVLAGKGLGKELKELISTFSLQHLRLSAHSLRKGGATYLLQTRAATESQVRLAGRWVSSRVLAKHYHQPLGVHAVMDALTPDMRADAELCSREAVARLELSEF